ncbi:MAG: hypothetical protein JWM89_168 [Acidimicrobiales bacterium]|nr:hypothetical protein [Acidimicrobiales bacterium]
MSSAPVVRNVGRLVVLGLLVASLATAVVAATPAGADVAPGSAYRQINLASDVPGMGLIQDPLMVNSWGLAMRGGSMFLAQAGTSTSGLYRSGSSGSIVRHATVPTLTIPGGLPTGVVSNPSAADFALTSGSAHGAARVLFASITGNIVGWNESVPFGSKTGIITASHPGHAYTGLAVANNGANHLYATDFANGNIDVYDKNFALVSLSGNFGDPTIPTTSGNTYHPYNVQAVGASLYVTYAKVGLNGRPEDGVGNGFVRRFNANGVRDLTFGINNGPLNSPWGTTPAPASFGIFGGALLVGNAGDGNPSIHAFNPTTGAFLGTIQDDAGTGIVIDRLHALAFGSGGAGSASTLYFTAGIGDEEHGLLGSLTPSTATATSTVAFSSADYTTSESAGSLQVTVIRSGDVSAAATGQYATWDQSQVGHASQKNDYQINTGLLTFPAGQTSASFTVLIGNDKLVEAPEIADLSLSNPKGTQVGGITHAQLTINDNDVAPSSTNPIDDPTFFVYRQYLDFFNRVPDAGGAAHWKKKITDCNGNAACISAARISVSAAFFLSSEFQNGVSLAYRVRKSMTGKAPLYGELMFDNTVRRSKGNAGLFDFAVTNPEFATNLGPLTNTQYVDKLIANSGGTFTSSQRSALINGLNGATKTRASVLGEVAGNASVQAAVFRPAFVFMQYVGYLRRDPDAGGYNHWLNRLNSFNGDYAAAGMVKNFVTSSEYRNRFGVN